MGYQQQYQNSIDPAFIGRVTTAAIQYIATVVIPEGQQPTPPTNHSARAALAKNFVTSPTSFAPQMANVVSSLTTYDNASAPPTDAQILAAVGNLWNAFAGSI